MTSSMIALTQSLAMRLQNFRDARFNSERGATAVEYTVLVIGVALVAVAALKLVGFEVSDSYSNINSEYERHSP